MNDKSPTRAELLAEIDRLQAECEAQQVLTTRFEQSAHPITIFDAEGRVVRLNAAAAAYYTVEREAIEGQILEAFFPDLFSLVMARISLVLESKQSIVVSDSIPVPGEDRSVWMTSIGEPFPVDDPQYAMFTTYEFGNRESVNHLQQQHDLLELLFETSPIGISLLDRDGNLRRMNRQAASILRLDDEAGVTYRDQRWLAFDLEGNPLPDEQRAFRQAKAAMAPVHDVQYIIEHPDGERVYLSLNASPLRDASGAFDGAILTLQDITRAKLTEIAMREQENFLQGIINANPLTLYVFHLRSGASTVFSDALREQLGYTPAEFDKLSIGLKSPLLHPDDRDDILAHIAEVADLEEGETLALQYRLRAKDGSWHWVRSINTPWALNADGQVMAIVGTVEDITKQVRIQSELEEAYARLSFHMSNSPLAVLKWSSDLRVVTYAGQAEAVFGWAAEEVLGLHWEEWDYVYSDDRPQIDDLNADLLDPDQPDQFITINRNKRKDGAIIWCQWYVSLRRTLEGEIDSILTFVQDITARVERQTALRTSQVMLTQAQSIASMYSFEWNVETDTVKWSNALRERYDLAEEVGPHAMLAHVLPADRPLVRSILASVRADTDRQTWEMTFRTLDRDGKNVLHKRFQAQRMEGSPHLILGYVQDITQMVETEQELRRHRAHLSELVEARTQELTAANQRLREMSRLKDEFVSNVSHELRTPLTSLKVRLHTLEHRPDALEDYLPVMRRETARLNQTIEDLLLLSQLDQVSDLEFVAITLSVFIEEYISDRQWMASQKGVQLSCQLNHSDLTIHADRGLVERLLEILVSNAIQYTPEGGAVVVRTVQTTRDHIAWAGFAVSDTGPGIPEEEQETVFERFIRGTMAYQANIPGTGLGLAIAKEIVKAHGGRIDLRSDTNGSTFTILLPV